MQARAFPRFCPVFFLACLLVAQSCTPWPILWPPTKPAPTPTDTAGTPPPTPADLYIAPGDVIVYPGPQRYAGDRLTLDVVPHNLGPIDPGAIFVEIYHERVAPDNVVARGVVGYPTFDEQPRARLIWAWDTSGLAGKVTLVAVVDPEDRIQVGDEDPSNNIVTLTLPLSPATALPALEAQTRWLSTTTDCCTFYYLDDTAADRDMPTITAVANESLDYVERQLGVEQPNPLRIYFLARVIGHGGYAYDAVALSYLDRHYAGCNLAMVLRHEGTHVLDGLNLRVYPPALLREGLATWVAGGHFKPEPIPERAAALLVLGRYIPLRPLAKDFYRQQHEIGYLEGAAFVAYLVDRYGWEAFWRFYNSFEPADGPEAMLEEALQRNFGRGLDETEEDWLAWLQAHPPAPAQVRDLQDTVALFDTVRRYQEHYDPAAYWMSGWMPDPADGVARGIVADFVRCPRAPENIALETMLIAAREALYRGDFATAEGLIAAVNRVLDTGSFDDAPAADYLAVVRAVAEAGYEAQQVHISGDTAQVWAIRDWPQLQQLTWQRVGGSWSPVVGGYQPRPN